MDAATFMEQALNATIAGVNRPMLVVMEYEKGCPQAMVKKIWSVLCQGQAVLVKGWEPEEKMEFTPDDITEYRPPIWQQVCWQGVLDFLILHVVI